MELGPRPEKWPGPRGSVVPGNQPVHQGRLVQGVAQAWEGSREGLVHIVHSKDGQGIVLVEGGLPLPHPLHPCSQVHRSIPRENSFRLEEVELQHRFPGCRSTRR